MVRRAPARLMANRRSIAEFTVANYKWFSLRRTVARQPIRPPGNTRQPGERGLMLKRLFKVMIVSSAVAFLLSGPSFAEPISEKYSVQEYEDIDEMSALLQSLVPDVEVDAEGKTLSLTAGSRESMEQALELLHQLDQPLARLALTVQVAGLSPTEQEMLGLQWQQAAIGTSWGCNSWSIFAPIRPNR